MSIRPTLVSLLAAFTTVSAVSAQNPPSNRHVVLISIDGFPARLWNDPALPAPNLRKLAAAGAQARAMTVSNPSITWINHTTLVTGVNPRKHGVLFNGLLVRQPNGMPPKIEQWADKERLVFVPTLYDVAHDAGLTTAESDWVAVTRAKTIDWSFPELPSPEGKVEREMIAAGAFSEQKIQWMQFGAGRKNSAWLDECWTRGAQFIWEKHRPNLLLYHILNTDAVHHTYGAGTMAGLCGPIGWRPASVHRGLGVEEGYDRLCGDRPRVQEGVQGRDAECGFEKRGLPADPRRSRVPV